MFADTDTTPDDDGDGDGVGVGVGAGGVGDGDGGGEVEPVLRGEDITKVKIYNLSGAAFTFFQDRVYFSAQRLVSVPLTAVTGKK